MLFLQQLRGELRKLFARPRTWMGYGAFLVMEALILFVYKLESGQRAVRGLVERNGLEFSTYYSSLSITFTIMLLSMFILGSIFFALVAGDIVAKENEDGNLRLVFSRPISRLRLLVVKYTAICIYTFSFVFFVGISGYAMAVAAVGWEGGMLVMEPKMKVFSVFPRWSDGAGALILASESAVKRFGLKPLARFVSYAARGVPPHIMGIGPIEAIPAALRHAGLRQDAIDWFELNEAFAAQSLAVINTLGLDPAKVNPMGGAIALGHPLGATGAIRAATAIHALHRHQLRYSMVTMCVGMGQGAAGIFERV